MLVSFDVKVLESDFYDYFATSNLWRSFLDIDIFMLKMVATCEISFCGIGCYRISYKKPIGCLVASSFRNFSFFFHF